LLVGYGQHFVYIALYHTYPLNTTAHTYKFTCRTTFYVEQLLLKIYIFHCGGANLSMEIASDML